MDPYEEHTDDDYTRKYSEFKNWVYAPLLGLISEHLASFQKFPPRQVPLTADFTVDIERIKQLLKTHN